MAKTRKSGRKGSRRATTASRRRTTMKGGAAPVGDTSMVGSGNQNLAQGRDYLNIHRGQHGGAAVSLAAAAPVGYTGMLDDSLRASARISTLDSSISDIQGMRDQSGGGRRRRRAGGSRKWKASRAKLIKLFRRMSKRRSMRGGAATGLTPADYGSPGMLLGASDSAKALLGMNPDWKLAADPTSFTPRS